MPESGVVKWFSQRKGYGFIQRDEGDDVFVHYSAVEAFEENPLQEGDAVQFETRDGANGPVAEKVMRS